MVFNVTSMIKTNVETKESYTFKRYADKVQNPDFEHVFQKPRGEDFKTITGAEMWRI